MRVVGIHDISALSDSERDLLGQELDDDGRLRGVELAVFEVQEKDEDSTYRCVAARSSKVEIGALVVARTWAGVRQLQSVIESDEGTEWRFASLNFADELVPEA